MAEGQNDNSYFQNIMRISLIRQEQTRILLNELENELRVSNRFFPRSVILKKIDRLVDEPHKTLKKGTILYRSRTIDKYQEDSIFSKIEDEMAEPYSKYYEKGWWGFDEQDSDAPPLGTVEGGRINPQGISYLYAADNEKTSVLEVRPVISQYVSIAEIELTENVRLFDFTMSNRRYHGENCEEQLLDWEVLSEYFSQPNYSGVSSYLAMQFISEYIKNIIDEAGNPLFDGVCFKSSLDSSGLNYALFDTSDNRKYKITCSSVYQVVDLLGNVEKQLPLDRKKG